MCRNLSAVVGNPVTAPTSRDAKSESQLKATRKIFQARDIADIPYVLMFPERIFTTCYKQRINTDAHHSQRFFLASFVPASTQPNLLNYIWYADVLHSPQVYHNLSSIRPIFASIFFKSRKSFQYHIASCSTVLLH
ncbi:predicted protein [Sclerotinia sclerotiorum 1980 UF-70]|uniref:Uncharacterized protein n=1 Tax=Sclerotinia sclerotiorum (strain ATCC 18683 / 1980 / Ss-1) TaxID=665079 RepID=A7EWR3_SCLS1|nr:predicted protein [Sclerotinia sclerotiorum 1980 UF-70]EDN93905.1 predicted protein [Sclerotinia sclerotiorum 1980 UF-70]